MTTNGDAVAAVALSGGLIAQYQGYADISSGMGLLVVGLASVIIGYLIGYPVVRLRRDYISLVTLGFGESVAQLLIKMSYNSSGSLKSAGELIPMIFPSITETLTHESCSPSKTIAHIPEPT